MGQVVTIGLDLAKSVFQVHGVDAAGEVVIRRQDQARAAFAGLPRQASRRASWAEGSLRVVASLGRGS